MGASRPDGRLGPLALGLFLLLGAAAEASARQAPDPVLDGTVLVGGEPLLRGTVVLHHLTGGEQGALDSTDVSQGRFSFELPRMPEPGRDDVFFASVRHQGVLYFGPAVTEAAQLDSVYEVVAYDTLLAPAEGVRLPLQSRSVFFEPDAGGWRVTDLFQVRNDQARTVVTRPGGIVWRHPLPAEATDVSTGEGELSFAAAEYEDGDLVVRAALPPGERLFVVRYRVDSIAIEIPNRGPTEALDVLIREPAPPVEVPGLELLDRIELEAGSTYRRFTGANLWQRAVTIVRSEEQPPPRVEWVSFLLAIVLGAVGLWVLRPTAAPALAGPGGGGPVRGGSGPGRGLDVGTVGPGGPRAGSRSASEAAQRRALLYEIARLDEDFAADTADAEATARYRARRAELLARVRSL